MMLKLFRIRLHWLVLSFIFGSSWNLSSQTLSESLETVFNDSDLMGMSVTVRVNGLKESLHFGLRDFERNLEVNSETKYRIASISKAFTALGIIKLYDEGNFELDDDISSHLGYTVENPNHPGTPITFRMLLSHTSGLQDGTGYNPFLNATYNQVPIPNISEVLLPGGNYYTSNMWRTETPGTYFNYSNISFGLIGTLIEAVSGERFDTYMKNEILEPMGIDGSFNIQDLPDIDDLAVLYRFNGGWQAQVDNYQGVYPSPPDLSGYVTGTNGVFFAPQGGLRCSSDEVEKFLRYLQTNGASTGPVVSAASISEMKNIQWDYNGSNGNNYGGLFNRWGLGLHHANVNPGDRVCPSLNYGPFLGHPGEAYGLISDGFFGNEQDVSFSLLINGSMNGYSVGGNSAFYSVEESIFDVLCDHFSETLGIAMTSGPAVEFHPNPTNSQLKVRYPGHDFSLTILDIQGKYLHDPVEGTNEIELDLSNLSPGLYLLNVQSESMSATYKIIKE